MAWVNTDLPLRHICTVPPHHPPKINPFLKWTPEVALVPTAADESILVINSDDEDDVEEIGGQDGAREQAGPSSASVSSLPFQLAPVPPLVPTVVPLSSTPKNYPRWRTYEWKRNSSQFTGTESYDWTQVVSILLT